MAWGPQCGLLAVRGDASALDRADLSRGKEGRNTRRNVEETVCGGRWAVSAERLQIGEVAKIFAPANLRAAQALPGYRVRGAGCILLRAKKAQGSERGAHSPQRRCRATASASGSPGFSTGCILLRATKALGSPQGAFSSERRKRWVLN